MTYHGSVSIPWNALSVEKGIDEMFGEDELEEVRRLLEGKGRVWIIAIDNNRYARFYYLSNGGRIDIIEL